MYAAKRKLTNYLCLNMSAKHDERHGDVAFNRSVILLDYHNRLNLTVKYVMIVADQLTRQRQ